MGLKAIAGSTASAIGRGFRATYHFLQSILLPLGAILALAEALYLAWIDKLGGAGVAAALFVLIFLFKHFPQLESFKGLGIEAKLRERLKEADDIIASIRQLSLVSAQQSYLQLAWMNRLGTPSNADKRALSGRFQDLLRHLKISEAEIEEARRPLIAMNLYDLWLQVYRVLSERVNYRIKQLTKERQSLVPAGTPMQVGSAEYARACQIDEETRRLREALEFDSERMLNDVLDLDRDPFGGVVKRVGLGAEDTPILLGYATKALALARDIKKSGGMTDEAEAFIGENKHNETARAYRELFSE
ncbi:hypothetical protein J8I29_19270 [Labrys sp. LIt4]|uniref:hypothetical protein n=1 Tax=Labrys sp. LIt4 TaxID=2821355 RepID=UPI001AE0991A|nr:hypothetical protein [Labrys sp. LIt4]MBP0581478.1 hypothetical protein [Labrys sp. LIt4]